VSAERDGGGLSLPGRRPRSASAPAGEDVRALARRFGLPEQAAEALETLTTLIARDPDAPTSLCRPEAIVADHLADSLVALELDVVRGAVAVADLGSGAGFPGLPLAIALPDAEVHLVESAARRASFIVRAAAACGLSNARVVQARAESWRAGLGRCDLVTARALAAPAVVAEYAAPLLRPGGSLVLWRGRRDTAEERAGAQAARLLGLEPGPVVRVRPYAGALHRHLHVMTKVRPTPPGFPRREGMAAKRPLGPPSDRSRR